jgi:ubiquinone/menaquinone biosynthesis C-methylase UbiE
MSERIDKTAFEELYIKVREKEKRIFSDKEVLELPYVKNKHVHFDEWAIRKSSFEKFKKSLSTRNISLNMLDIGCGNGWMSDKLSEINNSTVIGVDANRYEIEQAQRVFNNNKKVQFVYGNILENTLDNRERFDIIVLAASIQYFADINILIKKLFSLLNPKGEINILDSPLYNKKNVDKAKAASLNYYTNLGYPAMAEYYHLHLWEELEKFNFKIRNRSFLDRFLLKIFKTKHNYFPWIVIRKD